MVKESFEKLLQVTLEVFQAYYGERLVTLAVFGSVARGSQRMDSDVDLLLICDPLPAGRMRRVEEFENVEEQIAPFLLSLSQEGIDTRLSPVFKTPAEVQRGGSLYLDMTEDARLLYDRDGFFEHFLKEFRARLQRLGARRIWCGEAWFWDLKPDFKPGDVFEI